MQAWFLGNDFKGANITEYWGLSLVKCNLFSGWQATPLCRRTNLLFLEDIKMWMLIRKWETPNSCLCWIIFGFKSMKAILSLRRLFWWTMILLSRRILPHFFSLDLHGNVSCAVETCPEAFRRYYKYINFSNSIIGMVWSTGMRMSIWYEYFTWLHGGEQI